MSIETMNPIDAAPYTVAGPAERRRLRRVAGLIVVVPLLGLLLAVYLAVTRGIGALEIGIFLTAYILVLMGLTVGFHRHFAHRSFETGTAMRVVLAALGSMAGQGPLIWWVATHRRHHRLSDQDGDPHSPQLAGGTGLVKTLKGLWYGHIGWMFSDRISNWSLFARDMMNDRLVFRMHQLYFPFFFLGPDRIAHLQAFHKTINLPFRVHDALFAGIKRMALGANIGADFRDGSCRDPGIATCAGHSRFYVPIRVKRLLHSRISP